MATKGSSGRASRPPPRLFADVSLARGDESDGVAAVKVVEGPLLRIETADDGEQRVTAASTTV